MFKNKEDNELFKKVELNKYDLDSTEGKLFVENGNFIVPEVVTSIGDECFKGCLTLTSIQLPQNLKSIGDNAFYQTNISTITIPEGVTSIGNECFNWCT